MPSALTCALLYPCASISLAQIIRYTSVAAIMPNTDALENHTTGSVTSEDGTNIAFDRSGEGPSVILVEGAFRHRAIDQRTAQLAALLSPHFTVFRYDRRGRGGSGDTMPYAVQREIEDLEALIKGAGGSAYLFGKSSGAVLALRAAARGLSVRKLALYEPPFNSGDDNAHRASENYTRQLTGLLAEGRRGDAVAFAMTTFGAPPGAIAGLRQTPMWPAFESVAPTLAYDDAIMGDGSVPTGLLESVTAPALVMDGGESPAFMRGAARAVADGLPNAQYRTLQGQTHDVDPVVLAPVLVAFFRST
jgi:pimeloyl-ACP methyl ester carboxylesterase